MRPLADVISRRNSSTGAILHKAAVRRSSASTASSPSGVSEERSVSVASSKNPSDKSLIQSKMTRLNVRRPPARPAASRHSGNPRLIRRQRPIRVSAASAARKHPVAFRQEASQLPVGVAQPTALKDSTAPPRGDRQMSTEDDPPLWPGPAENGLGKSDKTIRERASQFLRGIRQR